MVDNRPAPVATPFMSPTEAIKKKSVDLMFDNIEHNSKSVDDKEKYAFFRKTKDLSIMLEKYTPKTARRELQDWYKQLDDEIEATKKSSGVQSAKDKKILNLRYMYSLEVHEHNQRILMNSPIIEVDAEGDLDITDSDIINVVRGGKRTDDARVIFKQ